MARESSRVVVRSLRSSVRRARRRRPQWTLVPTSCARVPPLRVLRRQRLAGPLPRVAGAAGAGSGAGAAVAFGAHFLRSGGLGAADRSRSSAVWMAGWRWDFSRVWSSGTASWLCRNGYGRYGAEAAAATGSGAGTLTGLSSCSAATAVAPLARCTPSQRSSATSLMTIEGVFGGGRGALQHALAERAAYGEHLVAVS